MENSDNTTRDVFISYHTNSSGEIVRRICAALEGAGISCWYAPRDVGANYAQSIVEAIRRCRVFLLVLNRDSNESAHVLNEVNCAFDRFRNREDITLLPFKIDDCAISDDVYYYLGRIHIMNGALPPELQRIQELVDRVSHILNHLPTKSVSLPAVPHVSSPATYRLTGVMARPDSRFVGRERELREIEDKLRECGKLFLVGMGGIGKSEIAKKYITDHRGEYDVVLWVTFDSSIRRTLLSDFSFPVEGLSRGDYPEDSDGDYFQRKLRILREICDRRVLIVLDNFDVPSDPDLEDFTSGDYGVIFTTRYRQENSSLPEVEIREMSEEGDLLALFRAEYTRGLDEAALGDVRRIIGLLNGHTLSVRLVASAMQHRRIKPSAMAELLSSGASSMARENVKAADMIFGRLREVFELSTLSGDELYILENLSLIPLSGVEVETFFTWCGAEDYDVIDGLIQKSWVIHDPVTDMVHLHPLISDLAAERGREDPSCWEKLMGSISSEAEGSDQRSFSFKELLYGCARRACEVIPESSGLWRDAVAANALLTKHMARYRESAALYAELLEGESDRARRANLYGTIAHCLTPFALEDPEACLQPALNGYALLKDIPVDELTHQEGVELVFLLNRLTEINRNIGNLDDAVEYARRAIAIAGRFARQSPQKSTGWCKYHLAATLLLRGDLPESRRELEEALELFDEISDSWSAMYARDLLSQVLCGLGELDEALRQNTRAGEEISGRYGPEHFDTAKNLQGRGDILLAMGEGAKAKLLYAEAARIYQKLNFVKAAEAALALSARCGE